MDFNSFSIVRLRIHKELQMDPLRTPENTLGNKCTFLCKKHPKERPYNPLDVGIPYKCLTYSFQK